MPEEKNVRQRDQHNLFNQCVAERINGMIDENAAVIERNNLHARWKTWLNLIDLFLHRVNHFAGVRCVADDHHSAHCLFAVLIESAAPELRSNLHAGDVAHRNRRAVVSAQRNIFNVLQSANQADAAHDIFSVADLDHLGADVVVAALNGRHHILERDVVGAQLHGVQINLILLHEAADARDFSHTGHGIELILDEPVLDGVQRAAVIRALHRVPEHLAHSGCVGAHHGRHICGQKAACEA